MTSEHLKNLVLGQKTNYPKKYDATLLQAIPRSLNRSEIDIDKSQPFTGADLWTCYEVAWLNQKGFPCLAIAEIIVDCQSANLIESKSLKLYLNSFNQHKFASLEIVEQIILKDLQNALQGKISVKLKKLQEFDNSPIAQLSGICIDDQDLEITNFDFDPNILKGVASGEIVTETLSSNLLKSNCLITNQPDWGSVIIRYKGKKLDQEKLLKYLISFRNHNEFHEHCVERIFCDLLKFANPSKLTVYARYTRRGGIEINPFRSNFELIPANTRLARQ